MKKIVITTIVIILLGAGYYFISPFFINKIVSETLPIAENTEDTSVEVIKQGQFAGFDKIHTGSGTANVISIGGKNYIRFEEDFVVANGPDLYVGLGQNGSYIKGSELSVLKGNMGSQNYELPEGVSPEEVWIWCKAFSVPFAKAVLNNTTI
ncbi:DM13 domain-containing protein [Candidatus Nomurabacteria bacterium]|nr:MAG: DM13 domain-containing protein [Candidatus Nomurabacteria bacterium]